MSFEKPIRVSPAWLRQWPLPPLQESADKGARGNVFLLAGSKEIPGAAILSAEAAFRTGAGKVTIMTARSIAAAVAIAVPEARVVPYAEAASGSIAKRAVRTAVLAASDASCVLIGPGLVSSSFFPDLIVAIRKVIPDVPLLMDAAAIRAIRHAKIPHGAGDGPYIVTPHSGEMADLIGIDKDTIEANPMEWATELCEAFRTVVVLKGADTWIAEPGGRLWLHSNANVGLAISGSGDVLAGIIAGLVVRGASAAQAAVWGVALHAMAGDRLGAKYGATGLLPREISKEIPALMNL